MTLNQIEALIGTTYKHNLMQDPTVDLDNCKKMFKNTPKWLSDENKTLKEECEPILIENGVIAPKRTPTSYEYRPARLLPNPSKLPKSKYYDNDLTLHGGRRKSHRRKTKRTNRRKRRSTRRARK
jgi:hypothetical protein